LASKSETQRSRFEMNVSDDQLAAALTDSALERYSPTVLNMAFLRSRGVNGKDVLRFTAAALAAMENTLIQNVADRLTAENIGALSQAIMRRFAIFTQNFDSAPIFRLADLACSTLEQEHVAKAFRVVTGQTATREELLERSASFQEWFRVLKFVRSSGFTGIYFAHANRDLRVALSMSFALWYYGRWTLTDEERPFIRDVVGHTVNCAAASVDEIFPMGNDSATATEAPDAKVLKHMFEEDRSLEFLHLVDHIPGTDRKEGILSVWYYRAETQFSVLNNWFTPERCLRADDLLSARRADAALLPDILDIGGLLEHLCMKYKQHNSSEVLSAIDQAVRVFFDKTGYMRVRSINVPTKDKPQVRPWP
jgi:hypothetical protein